MTDLGSWVCLYEENDSMWTVAPEDEPRIDAAVSRYLETGRDSLLDLTTTEGWALKLRASVVVGWFLSTPEGRVRSLEMGQAQRAEREANKQRLGIWEDDE